MGITKDKAKEILNLNPNKLVDENIANRQFEVIVESFNHLYSGKQYVYIADEVGLGKTYIALGITSLLRHFSENPGSYKDFIVVPKKNLQFKWQKEIYSFIENNYLLTDNRVKSILKTPVGNCGKEQNHDRFDLITNDSPAYHLFRTSSFSMATYENFVWADLFIQFPQWASIKRFLWRKKHDNSFCRRLYAFLMNINSVPIDCLIIDEAHNYRLGIYGDVSQRNEVLSRFMGNILEIDNNIFEFIPEIKPLIAPLASKTIFLSATPINHGLIQLKNQLDVFIPEHDFANLEAEDLDFNIKDNLCSFLIRGVMYIQINGKEHSRNMYRWEHRRGNVEEKEDADPIRLNNNKISLITGLIQYKTMESLSLKNNPSFEIGLLAGFESFTPKPSKQENEYDNSIQTNHKESEDSNIIQKLSRSFYKEFNETLPHLKQDLLIEELLKFMQKNQKALVFVMRIASSVELEHKLLESYCKLLFDKVLIFAKKNASAKLNVLIKAYNQKSDRDSIEDVLSLLSKRLFQSYKKQLIAILPTLVSTTDLNTYLLTLFDQTEYEDEWAHHTYNLKSFQSKVVDHIGRKNRIDKDLTILTYELLVACRILLLDDHDPDDTNENEDQGFENEGPSNYFFDIFFKGKGKRFRNATYENPWYELNTYFINQHFELFGFDLKNYEKLTYVAQGQKDALIFRNEKEHYESVLSDEEYTSHSLKTEMLNTATFLTDLLLINCKQEFADWVTRHRKKRKEVFLDSLNALVEILKGIFRNGSGLLPAYLAWTTNQFKSKLIELLEGDFNFVLIEIKTIIIDFERIMTSNFPDPSKIKYTLYNQSPVQGVSGNQKVNVSKTAAQFRMPGYPYILVTTDILKEGEDLHSYCSRVFHYGVAYNPSDMEQRTGRIDRIGSKCYYGLQDVEGQEIPFKDKLQVYFPYLSDTLEVNQIAKVFHGMDEFVKTFYDFTDTPIISSSVSLNDTVAVIPDQINDKLKSKYDIDKFILKHDYSLDLNSMPQFGISREDLTHQMKILNDLIVQKHVDRYNEFCNFDCESLRIVGLIYEEVKVRQCPFKVNVVNGRTAGDFLYEIISPITNRSNLNRGAINDIRSKLTDEQLYEHNNVYYARKYVNIREDINQIINTLEDLVFLADELEEKYAKEDFNFWGK